MTDTTAADIARTQILVGQALAASPRSATVHFAKGEVLRAEKRYEEAVPEYETVLALDRNSASALLALGHCKLMIGSIEELIPFVEQAMRLSPRDPQLAVMYYRIGEVHLLQSSTDKAIPCFEKARSTPIQNFTTFTPSSPLPMPSTARPNVLPPNLPKPEDWSATIIIQASPA